MKVDYGNRKLKEAYFVGLLLFLGFVVAAYLKVDNNLYFGLCAALCGKLGLFMYGNGVSAKYSAEKVESKESN